MELHLVPVEVLPVESCEQHIPVPEAALVGQIMEREQCGNATVKRDVCVFDPQVGRDESGLPIVAVQYVNRDANGAKRLHYGATKESEPFAIVLVVRAVLTVQLRPVKIAVLFHQVHGNARVR